MKVFPSDIDAVVERFERTGDVCTFALDDPIYGQNVGIAVVLQDRSDETICSLYSWMKSHLSESKMPVRWWLVDEIPRTSRGKINRDAVKAACQDLLPLDLPGILGNNGLRVKYGSSDGRVSSIFCGQSRKLDVRSKAWMTAISWLPLV